MKSIVLRVLVVSSVAVLVPVLGARAQIIAGEGLTKGPLYKPGDKAKGAPPPTALPGAVTDKERVAPADKVVGDLSPTDALFDGINRGDIGTVRDAVNRGADLDARSVLGQSPLELSVDLGRNDVTFLLLSLRGTDGTARAGAKEAAAARQAKLDPAVIRREKAMAAKAERERLRSTGVAARERATPGLATEGNAPLSAQVRTTQKFAGDSGTPNANAGFLGFGAVTR